MDLLYFESFLKDITKLEYKINLDLKVKYEDNKKIFNIYKNDVLQIKIHFVEPIEHLTIFETYMLYLIFIKKLKPYDYANFHKSTYGQKFIQNIESLYINEPITTTTNSLKAI